MATWTVLNFVVAEPERRLKDLRKQLPITHVAGLVTTSTNSELGEWETESSPNHIIAVGADENLTQFEITNKAIFCHYVNGFLKTDELLSVCRYNNTSDTGWVAIYKCKNDSSVELLEVLGEQPHKRGGQVSLKCYLEYGFDAVLIHKSNISAGVLEWYRDLYRFEEALSQGIIRPIPSTEQCPECGENAIGLENSNRFYDNDDCGSCFISERYVYTPGTLDPPQGACTDCGGTFVRRKLQYPGLGSTVYECEDCGRFTADTFELGVNELFPENYRVEFIPTELNDTSDDGDETCSQRSRRRPPRLRLEDFDILLPETAPDHSERELVNSLCQSLSHDKPQIRRRSAEGIRASTGGSGSISPEVVSPLIDCLEDEDIFVRMATVEAIQTLLSNQQRIPTLTESTGQQEPECTNNFSRVAADEFLDYFDTCCRSNDLSNGNDRHYRYEMQLASKGLLMCGVRHGEKLETWIREEHDDAP